MGFYERGDLRLHYETHGDGFPLLLLAPGGMRSRIEAWSSVPWDPIKTLAQHFRVIAMDQRNAGQSTGPISGQDSWSDYTDDQLALLDHLGVERCHIMGCCIGGPFCLGLIQAAPTRIQSAVLLQPIGATKENHDAFYELFDGWAEELNAGGRGLDPAELASFRSNMYDGDFVYNVSRDFVRNIQTPMMVLMGNDLYHPSHTSREVVELAPNATLIESWKDGDAIETARDAVVEFLLEQTPR